MVELSYWRRFVGGACGLMLALAAVPLQCISAEAQTLTNRPGTIGHALKLPDGSEVYLDAVAVDAAAQSLFVVRECLDYSARLVVLASPTTPFHLGQSVDVHGLMVTVSPGVRAVTSARVYAYLDREGVIRYTPVMKSPLGPDTSVSLADITAPYSQPDRLQVKSGPWTPPPPPGPAPFYDTVAEVLGLDPGDLAELQCLDVDAIGTYQTYNYSLLSDGGGLPLKTFAGQQLVTSDRVNRVSGQVRTLGSETILDVDSGPGYSAQLYIGQIQSAPEGTIGWAQTFQDDTTLPSALAGKIVSADSADFPGALYIQEPGRSGGIRVLYTGSVTPSRGNSVTVSGVIGVGEDGERQIDAGTTGISIDEGQPAVPTPLIIRNADLGGSFLNVKTPGVTRPPATWGLYNKGLLLKAVGEVVAIDLAHKCFYIDDGSQLVDGTGMTGIRVSWDWPTSGKSSITPPDYGSLVAVTGISGSQVRGSDLIRVLRVRDQSDIEELTDSLHEVEFDRGLPTEDVNEASGADRCNIAWTGNDSTIIYGDDFSLPTGDWTVDTLRMWFVADVPPVPEYELGDHFSQVDLYTSTGASAAELRCTSLLAEHGSAAADPNIVFVRAVYPDVTGSAFQAFNGRMQQMWQVEFRNLQWDVTGGQTLNFGLRLIPRIDRTALAVASSSVEAEWDGDLRQFDSANLASGASSATGSVWFGGRGSDVNVQVFARER